MWFIAHQSIPRTPVDTNEKIALAGVIVATLALLVSFGTWLLPVAPQSSTLPPIVTDASVVIAYEGTTTSIPVDTPLPLPTFTPTPVFRSCQEILENDASKASGEYIIDADGPSGDLQPFQVYCEMERQVDPSNENLSGGWTLFARHMDGIQVQEVQTVTVSNYGVMQAEKWRAVRDNMIAGMMFVDELGRTSFISSAKLNVGNCQNVQNPDTLLISSQRGFHIWHHEESGCDVSGQDYSIVRLDDSPYGAALYQQSKMKFDIWPYREASSSYGIQDELRYYIK